MQYTNKSMQPIIKMTAQVFNDRKICQLDEEGTNLNTTCAVLGSLASSAHSDESEGSSCREMKSDVVEAA